MTQHWPAERVERRAIAALQPYPQNARTHSEEQVGQIAASMRRWGWTVPILVDDSGLVIAGHGRLLAAQALGFTEAPVMVAKGWSEAETRAYRLADNQLTLNGGWDVSLLTGEIQALKEWEFDLELLGFSDIDALLRGEELVDPDKIPEPPTHPTTRRGDVWRLGRHCLICGDCRDAADVARLVDGTTINLAFTSPPYAEQRDYDGTSGFEPTHPDAYVNWFEPVAANVAHHLASDGSWFVNIKPSCEGLDTSLYVMDLVVAHVRAWGWHFATEFCWERGGVPKSVTQRFKNQFEPIYQFARGRWKMRPDAVRHESENVPRAGGPGSGEMSWAAKQGGVGAYSVSGSFGAAKKRRNGTSEFMSDTQGHNTKPGEYIGPGLAYPGNRLPTFSLTHTATGHAAAFPVGLPEFFCKAFTDRDDVVFDPFCGSGSTIIAAERSGRAGLGCEISPIYCDVTIERWQSFTGDTAKLAGTDKGFAQVKAERSR